MIPRGQLQSFVSTSTPRMTGSDGASVLLSPDSFVDANGNPVSGNIDVTITPVDVSNPALLGAFPGEFAGVATGESTATPIVSLGTVEYVFSQGGEPLQLAPGKTATIEIPIYFANYPDGSAITINDTIPLWSLDSATGIWTQEGNGTVIASQASPTGLALSATTTHFTWWNCDVSMNAAQAIVTVLGNGAGTALVKASTAANIGWRPSTVETVVELGVASIPLNIPSNGEVYFGRISVLPMVPVPRHRTQPSLSTCTPRILDLWPL